MILKSDIQIGYPGHAMIVVDMIDHIDGNGRKAILVAQSYMPAQEIHIVTNLNSPETSPWYIIDSNTTSIHFPEWTFSASELKRFKKEEQTTISANGRIHESTLPNPPVLRQSVSCKPAL